MKIKKAIAIHNPDNVGELNKALEEGFDIYQTYTVKASTIFILSKWVETEEDRLNRNNNVEGTNITGLSRDTIPTMRG